MQAVASRLTVLFTAMILTSCANQTGLDTHILMMQRLDNITASLISRTPNPRTPNQSKDLSKDIDIANIPILLKQDRKPNASTDGRAVYITSGLMNRVNDLALALIIAHELGHISLNHYCSQNPTIQLEQEADRYAVFLLARAGLDYEGAVKLSAATQAPHTSNGSYSTSEANRKANLEAKRAENFRAVIVEIEALKTSGTPLKL